MTNNQTSSSLSNTANNASNSLKEENIENQSQLALDFLSKQMKKSFGNNKSSSKMNPQAFNFNNLVPLLQGRARVADENCMNSSENFADSGK